MTIAFDIVFQLLLLCLCIVCEEEPSSQTVIRYTRPKCRTDADCHNKAFCYGNDNNVIGYCKCQDGYEMSIEGKYYECLAASKLGERCEQNIQCEILAGPLAICVGYDHNKYCACNSTIAHATESKECFETKLLNDFCLVDENCFLSESTVGEYKFGICNFGVCSCPLGKRPSNSRKRCVVFKKIDEICQSDEECQAFTDSAVCRIRCTCETGFAISLDRQKCLKAALKFGDPCLENEQCSKYLKQSVCNNLTCSCPTHFHGYRTACRQDIMPGEACFDDGDCMINQSLRKEVKCNKGVCTCVHGRSYDDRICLSGGAITPTFNIIYLLLCIAIVRYSHNFIY